MSRWLFAGLSALALGVLLAGSLGAQKSSPPPLPPDEDAPIKAAPPPRPKPQSNTPQSSADQTGKSQSDDALPPDEDAASAAANEKVAFNPVQSKKFVSVGDFYFKKNDFKAATIRYRDATRYNDANAEAWLKLGEAEEKRGSPKNARAAYEKYLQLAPNARNASEIKKRLDKLN
jgi:cytochrome c-type biogenesis protein CcmH/NrfG